MRKGVDADNTPIKDSMLAGLHHWLLASGIPALFLLVPGFKPSKADFSPSSTLPVEDAKPLVTVLQDMLHIHIDEAKLPQLRMAPGWPGQAPEVAKLDLMYT